MEPLARRILLLARHEASTVDPATVYKLSVDITGSYEGGLLRSMFTFRMDALSAYRSVQHHVSF